MLMEADVEGLVGAGRYERTGQQIHWRPAYRNRTPDMRFRLKLSAKRYAVRATMLGYDGR
jgi:hypothetical protein